MARTDSRTDQGSVNKAQAQTIGRNAYDSIAAEAEVKSKQVQYLEGEIKERDHQIKQLEIELLDLYRKLCY